MPRARCRAATSLAAALIGALALSSLTALPAHAEATDAQLTVKIQKVEASGSPDFVELVNTGKASVDISGWQVLDNDDTHAPIVFPTGTTIAAHASLAFNTQTSNVPGGGAGFGLGGSGDSVRLFLPASAGAAVADFVAIDSFTWTASAGTGNNFQRCATGDGAEFSLVAATASAAGAALNCPTANWNNVVINEVEANGPTAGFAAVKDWVELTNKGASSVDISGWRFIDNHGSLDATEGDWFTVPSGTTLAPGAFYWLDLNSIGLGGGGDQANLYLSDDFTLVDSYSWSTAATSGTDASRCPDGTGAFGAATPTPDAANSCDPSGPTDPTDPTEPTADQLAVKIQKVEASGSPDFVELVNTGKTAVDISGWQALDNDDTHAPIVFPTGTTISAHGMLAFNTQTSNVPGGSSGFGLGGSGDSVRVFLPASSGTAVADFVAIDSFTWTGSAGAGNNFQRCATGDGQSFSVLAAAASASGAALNCPAANWNNVAINEVEASGPTAGFSGAVKDWVELTNKGLAAVNIGGWRFIDNHGNLTTTDSDWFTIPSGTILDPGALYTLDLGSIGLGGTADEANLYLPDDMTLVDSYSWASAATAGTDASRCPDGTGAFAPGTPTPGALNKCGTTPPTGGTHERTDAVVWPGGQDVTTVDAAGTFNGDASGLVFDPTDSSVLWVAQNKKGTLWRLKWDAATSQYLPDTAAGWGAGRDPHFSSGTGHPDTEGITVGPDGQVYLTSERNNDNSNVSRIAVLRYSPTAGNATDGTTATAEWDLQADFPQVSTSLVADANLGPEGITWVPDSYLVAHGFQDSTGSPYDPAAYPNHGTGLYVVALEKDGGLYAFALQDNGDGGIQPHALVNSFSSGFDTVMDVAWDPELQSLRATCDNTCSGQSTVLSIDGTGHFAVDAAYERPTGLPNYNNEGFAVAPQSECLAGSKTAIWADDGDDEGFSLRAGTIDCTGVAQTVAFTSSAPTAAVVGTSYTVTTTGGASTNPVVVTSTTPAVCTVDGSTVHLGHAGTCALAADQAAAKGFEAGSATQSFVIGKAVSTTTVAVTATTIVATVGVVEPAVAALEGATVDFTVDGEDAGSAPIAEDGTATLARVVPTDDSHTVVATFAGTDDITGSTNSVTRANPTITAEVTSTVAKSAYGWYREPVTVTFTCVTHGSALAEPCPSPITLQSSGANRSVAASIVALDGGAASVTAGGISIDRIAPSVKITGAVSGRLYVGTTPSAKCAGTDALSGVARCTITKKVTPTSTTLTATATDKAGNTRSTSLRYLTLAYYLKGATYSAGVFTAQRGHHYTLAATVKTIARVYSPVEHGTSTTYRMMTSSSVVTIPSNAKPGSVWKVVVKTGGKTYTVRMRATR